MPQAEGDRSVQMGLTEFGRIVWGMAAKRGHTTQRGLASSIGMSHDALYNYLHGRTTVPPRMLHLLDKALGLTEEEKWELSWTFAWGETIREKGAA